MMLMQILQDPINQKVFPQPIRTMNEYQTIINYGAGIALAVSGWFARTLWSAVQDLKTDLAKLREELPKTYTPKDDFREAMNKIESMFQRISDKLDDKADK